MSAEICTTAKNESLKPQTGRGQAGVKGGAAYLVAVLVFVPAPQHLQPFAGSLHLCVFLLLGQKRSASKNEEFIEEAYNRFENRC